MPIPPQRFEAILDEYDQLLLQHNTLRFAISELIHGIPEALRTDPRVAMMTSYVSGPPIPQAALVQVERHWFKRFGRHNARERERAARVRANGGLRGPSTPRAEAKGAYTHQTIFVDPAAQALAEEEDGGVDL